MLGLDLHPAVVHFPVALTVTGALGEIAYLLVRRPWLRWFGPILLTLALLGSGAAYFSGQAVHDKAFDQGVPHDAIEAHLNSCLWALGALALSTLLSWATHSRGKGIWVPALLALAAAGLTLYTGYQGGELVYKYGAGRVAAAGARGGASTRDGMSRGGETRGSADTTAAADSARGGDDHHHDDGDDTHEH